MEQFCTQSCGAAPEAEMHRLADGTKKMTSEFAYRAELIMASLNGLNVFFRSTKCNIILNKDCLLCSCLYK